MSIREEETTRIDSSGSRHRRAGGGAERTIACVLTGVALALFLSCLPASAQTRLPLTTTDLLETGRLYVAGDESFPPARQDIASWLAQRRPVDQISLLGGSYWLYAEVRHSTAIVDWVLDPTNTLIEDVEMRVYAPDGGVQQLLTGYLRDHQYMLHYGKDVRLLPDVDYRVVVRFRSPYFASYPRFDVLPEIDYRNKVAIENVQILGALGALLSLAIFNFFIFALTRDKSHVYYSVYLTTYCLGWAFVFNIPAEAFGVRNLHLHYVPFFLLPVLNTLFYVEFLKLKKYFPRLAVVSRVNYVLPLLLLPSAFFALSYAHALATVVISLWLMLGLVCGIASWRKGYRPARYFVLAFVAILIPGAIILPANIGLLPDLVENAELFTLLGGTLDGLLLAFALADRIKLLDDERERYLNGLNRALDMAHTDALTGMGNRYAFDQMLNERFDLTAGANDPNQQILVLIDLDGLKGINDRYGHPSGDTVLRVVGTGLRSLEKTGISCFRIGGDEFAVVARRHQEPEIFVAFASIERVLLEHGFAEAGLSYGISSASECASVAELINSSDERMYRHKARHRADGRMLPPRPSG